MILTITPTNDDCLKHCINAINEFKELKNIKSLYRLEYINWRLKYMELDEFIFPAEFKNNKHLMQFKRYYKKSISVYYALTEKDERDNKDERVRIDLEGERFDTKGIWSFTTALSPTNDDSKYDIELWNHALNNERYYSFYLEGNPTINAFSLMGDEFKMDVTIIIIGENGKLRFFCKNKEEIHLMSRVKGILFINTKKIQDDLQFYVSRGNQFLIERVGFIK